jgi:aryl-alcohol dehydrogenase-like predicted oxidoreductase
LNHRYFFGLNRQISEVGIGTWQLGGAEWGKVTEQQAIETLRAAADAGVDLIDTADIYGHGRSEQLIGKFIGEKSVADQFTVITKFGRSPDPGWPGNFEKKTLVAHTEASIQRLSVEALDLTQSHCIPSEYLADGEVWETMRELKRVGKIKAFGASVESMQEAIQCLDVEGLCSLQIIFNIFRQKPIEALFAKAKEKNVAIIVRLPLASGLLSGKFKPDTTFDSTDHRSFNENGDSFNVGETFAGLGLEKGVQLTEQIRHFVPDGCTMAQWALRWCLDFPEVTTVIPGSKHAEQSRQNAAASNLPPLSADVHQQLSDFYQNSVADFVRGKY